MISFVVEGVLNETDELRDVEYVVNSEPGEDQCVRRHDPATTLAHVLVYLEEVREPLEVSQRLNHDHKVHDQVQYLEHHPGYKQRLIYVPELVMERINLTHLAQCLRDYVQEIDCDVAVCLVVDALYFTLQLLLGCITHLQVGVDPAHLGYNQYEAHFAVEEQTDNAFEYNADRAVFVV